MGAQVISPHAGGLSARPSVVADYRITITVAWVLYGAK